ncbi:hypothetical protein AAFF_G00071510 [Aldrovandia affinis]|uniref:Uncharacterized protein n=1 Tax=Aldrovandia affinis TaxID=143900 RepID=A0AAD7RZA1_9TELE|nr:hypothetical protein AAFF_G00071510 [Aldrovandia affinis]
MVVRTHLVQRCPLWKLVWSQTSLCTHQSGGRIITPSPERWGGRGWADSEHVAGGALGNGPDRHMPSPGNALLPVKSLAPKSSALWAGEARGRGSEYGLDFGPAYQMSTQTSIEMGWRARAVSLGAC